MTRNQDWSQEEVDATVESYLDMLELELRGEAYSKTMHRAVLAPRLDHCRTRPAMERKYANISAYMVASGFPYIDGYKPLGHGQGILGMAVDRQVQQRPDLLQVIRTVMAAVPTVVNPALLSRVDIPARGPSHGAGPKAPSTSMLPDYVAMHEHCLQLGDWGERLVLQREQQDLAGSGLPDLARQVRWTAKDEGPWSGYDIRSFFPDGREKFIEVKTTNFGQYTPFFLSRHELETSCRLGANYRIYRLFMARTDPRYYELTPPIHSHCRLSPAVYKADVHLAS